MCGFVGLCDLKRDISGAESVNNLKVLTNSLSHRGPDEYGFYINKHVNLGHRRLIILDAENGKQPMTYKHDDNTYTIVYNGQLYNAKDIKNNLIDLGYEFNRIL